MLSTLQPSLSGCLVDGVSQTVDATQRLVFREGVPRSEHKLLAFLNMLRCVEARLWSGNPDACHGDGICCLPGLRRILDLVARRVSRHFCRGGIESGHRDVSDSNYDRGEGFPDPLAWQQVQGIPQLTAISAGRRWPLLQLFRQFLLKLLQLEFAACHKVCCSGDTASAGLLLKIANDGLSAATAQIAHAGLQAVRDLLDGAGVIFIDATPDRFQMAGQIFEEHFDQFLHEVDLTIDHVQYRVAVKHDGFGCDHRHNESP